MQPRWHGHDHCVLGRIAMPVLLLCVSSSLFSLCLLGWRRGARAFADQAVVLDPAVLGKSVSFPRLCHLPILISTLRNQLFAGIPHIKPSAAKQSTILDESNCRGASKRKCDMYSHTGEVLPL